MWLIRLHLVMTCIVGVAGWQDWKHREVSNYVTIPLFSTGMISIILRALFWHPDGVNILFLLMVIGILTVAALQGWMGGADWKVLVGLWALWPLGGFIALFSAAIYSAGAMLTSKECQARFPGVAIFAIATIITLILNPN